MTISWYSISISLQSGGGAIFNGYFSVDNDTNLLTAFYETINGSTNFNNNILIPTGTGVVYRSYLGFTVYSISDGNVYYDNAYLPTWLQFDNYGVIINSMSAYPQYNNFNLWASELGDESINNIGIVGINENNEQLNGIFTITLILDPPSCFNEGTKILSLNKNLEEEYIPIENLRKGDLVKSYQHGYRKIDLIGKNPMINNPEKFNECMYKMEKTSENGLIEDLIVTGGHAILVDDLGICKEENDKIFGTTFMIDDKYLLLSAVSKEFLKLENTNVYTYYHFILENNGNDDKRFGVWANGILTETPSKNQFNNHKYTLL